MKIIIDIPDGDTNNHCSGLCPFNKEIAGSRYCAIYNISLTLCVDVREPIRCNICKAAELSINAKDIEWVESWYNILAGGDVSIATSDFCEEYKMNEEEKLVMSKFLELRNMIDS